jgi:hypothetical protein
VFLSDFRGELYAKQGAGILQNGVEPLLYLRTLFEKAPVASTTEDWEKLLPWNIFKA